MADPSELESFRQQWREEVSVRHRPPKPQTRAVQQEGRELSSKQDETVADGAQLKSDTHNDTGTLERSMRSLHLQDGVDLAVAREPEKPPESALEHFEEAVKKEAQGSLGQSLDLYRKAYRLDNDVDKAYRKKHYPKANKPSSQALPTSSTGAVTRPNKGAEASLPTAQLIASFANAPILPEEPLIEGTPPAPCPLSHAPSEIIAQVLRVVARNDPATLAKIALVCKRLAWHVSNEQSVYKLLCHSGRFGMRHMHYTWKTDVLGHPIYTLSLTPSLHPHWDTTRNDIPAPFTSWRTAYQSLPRIRFTGIYISTVNYNRPGAHSDLTNVSWGAPIHIVTYYRYLRFYADGTVISLVTTTEPADIVRHISKENIETLRSAAPATRRTLHHHQPARPDLPSASDAKQPAVANPIPYSIQTVLKTALKGRWRLDHHPTNPTPTPPEPGPTPPLSAHEQSLHPPSTPSDPRDVTVETEGVDAKYLFRMHLSLRSAHSRSANVARNTRLVWRGFWSYNSVTDDWAEFGLRHDRPFVFCRVRGWGMEEVVG